MNIFFLDENPEIAAQYQCDKHVVKMILESAQIMCAVHHLTDHYHPSLYRLTHRNHPCVLWIKESKAHYQWLFDHYKALCSEYTYRYNKKHKTEMLTPIISEIPVELPDKGFSWSLRVTDNELVDVILSYRQYYVNKSKVMIMTWRNREIPHFMELV